MPMALSAWQHSLSSLEEGLAAIADREEEQAQRLERALTKRQGEGSAGASARPAARGPSKWAALKTANGHVRPDLLAQVRLACCALKACGGEPPLPHSR